MKKKLSLILLMLTSVSLATLTGVTLNNPAGDSFIKGTIILNATLDSGNTADNASFYYIIGSTKTFIGNNSTSGSSFTLSWNTASISDSCGVTVEVNVTNGSISNTSQNSGITIDNSVPLILNVSNTTINEHNITIKVITSNTPVCSYGGNQTNTSINYGNTTLLGSTRTNTTYSSVSYVTLTSLSENTTYYYNVTSCDQAGNCNTTGPYNFTTLSIPPVISSVQASTVWSDYAVIQWTTNENANASINYGTTTALGNTSYYNSTKSTSHSFNITSLTNGTTYYYNVTSCDAAGNCNTTGTYNFTTKVDTTPPEIQTLLINDKQSTTVTLNEYVNITSYVTDNINVTSVWARITNVDGTSVNKTMSLLSGSTYYVLYNATKSGVSNVTVFAKDYYNNTAEWSSSTYPRNFTAYGYFSLSSNISSPFKNFTIGSSYAYLLTIHNTDDITENYSLSVSSSVSSWTASLNQSSVTNLASLSSASVKVTVAVPSNATGSAVITATVVSANTSHTETKAITFTVPTISFSHPTSVVVSNKSSVTSFVYIYKNTTNTTWEKWINVTGIGNFSCQVDGAVSNATVTCGLYSGKTLKKAGTYHNTTNSCFFNVTGLATGKYNMTVNVTDWRNHKGSYKILIPVPSSSINVTLSSIDSVVKGGTFTVTGVAKYAEGFNVAPLTTSNIEIHYSSTTCTGSTSTTGSFSIKCTAPSTVGTYSLNATAKGVFNTSGTSSAISLKVVKAATHNQTAKENAVMKIEPASLTMDSDSKTLLVTITNNYNSSKTFNISIKEEGSYKHFNASTSTKTLKVSANSANSFEVSVRRVDNAKPGSYNLVVKAKASGVSLEKKVAVTIPEPKLRANDVDSYKFVEKNTLANKTRFGIIVVNNINTTVVVNVTETIPKTVANSTSELIFSEEPIIIQEDPVVMWNLTLQPGERKELSYTVNKIIENASVEAPVISFSQNMTVKGEVVAKTTRGSKKIFLIILILLISGASIVWLLFKEQAVRALQKINNRLPFKIPFIPKEEEKSKYPFMEKIKELRQKELAGQQKTGEKEIKKEEESS